MSLRTGFERESIGKVDFRGSKFFLDVFDHLVFSILHCNYFIRGRTVIIDGFDEFLNLKLSTNRLWIIESFCHGEMKCEGKE